MPEGSPKFADLDPAKFLDPYVTAKGEVRASVPMVQLETLWFNTGSLCNIQCENCYMDSGPKNDALAYLQSSHIDSFLDEAKALQLPLKTVGFTGGEPFMNPDLVDMLENALKRGFNVVVLTNAMKPLWHKRKALLDLKTRYNSDQLTFRVSIDHFTRDLHEQERGDDTWPPMEIGIKWLSQHGFQLNVAGRTQWGEDEMQSRRGYQKLFDTLNLSINAFDSVQLVLFAEMDEHIDVPEITTACWEILGVRPDVQMCATSRMVAWRKGEPVPFVTPCTLLPNAPSFDMGQSLKNALGDIQLNHPHCAKFCVLGGCSCAA